MIAPTVVLQDTILALDNGYEYIAHQGGTYSGKTYSILIAIAIHMNRSNNSLKVSVVGQTSIELTYGAYADWENIMEDLGIGVCVSKTLRKWVINKSSIIFQSIDTEGKAKSGKWSLTFFNEANHIPYEIYRQRSLRSNVKIIDFNPSSKFWFHTKIHPTFPTFKSLYRRTTYKDNPTLTDEKIREIEALITDDYMYKVYALGEMPDLDGLVFKHKTHIHNDLYQFSNHAYFLDFGFTNDVTCLGEAATDGSKLYVNELIYKTGLLTKDLNELMLSLGVSKNMPIYCDNIPKEVAELAVYGWRLIKANKYAGSVLDGINLLKQQEIFIHHKAHNFIHEAENYEWIKKNGENINVPMDKFNHFWDGLRYYAQSNCTGLMRGNRKIVGLSNII